MKRSNLTASCAAAAGLFFIWVTPAFAYLGPGAERIATKAAS
jgi:hypothetical protein